MPRYALELHHPDGHTTTGDYTSDHAYGEASTLTLTDGQREQGWRVMTVEEAPEPFIAKLVCARLATSWRVHVASMPGLTTSERVLAQVTAALETDGRLSGPSVSFDGETGALRATAVVDEPRHGAAMFTGVEAFYDALRAASFNVDVPGWRLLVETEPLFEAQDDLDPR